MKLSNSYLCRHKSARLSRRDRLPQAANALGCRSSLGSLAFFRWVHGFRVGQSSSNPEQAKRIGVRRASCRLRSEEASRKTNGPPDRQDMKIRADPGRSEAHDCAAGSPRQSDQAITRCCSAGQANMRGTESKGPRHALRDHPRWDARCLL